MISRAPRSRIALFAMAGLLACAAMVSAQPARAADDPRVERLEKQVRELRAIVFQARDTGHPVEVKPEGPDPALAALSARIDDLEATLRKLQGEGETSAHDADQARLALEAEKADRIAQTQAMSDRITRLESQLVTLSAPPPPPPEMDAKGHRIARPSSAPPAVAASGAAPASDVVAPSAGDPAAEFKTARALLASGDYGGASQAFQSFVSAHPADARASEAYYWLGESYNVRDLSGDATAAYARALKGWPKTLWAPDAVIKLARSLAATKRTPEACAALSEFTRRYGAVATPSAKTRAQQTRDKIGCGG